MFQSRVYYQTGMAVKFGWLTDEGILQFAGSDGGCTAEGGFYTSG